MRFDKKIFMVYNSTKVRKAYPITMLSVNSRKETKNMRRFCMVACVLALFCSSAIARTIPGAPNEVRNPYFNDEQGVVDGWFIGEYSPYVVWLTPTTKYVLTPYAQLGNSISADPQVGTIFLRTIVDDYEGLWNPDFNNKEIDLSFFANVSGDGFIKFRFDWWDDETIPRPEDNPTGQLPAADGYTPWITITELDMGACTELGPEWLRPNEEILPGFKLYDYREIWDHQPRWVSIEFEVGVVDEDINGDGQVGVGVPELTGVDFEARCVDGVPEPGSMLFFGFGILGWLYRRFRK